MRVAWRIILARSLFVLLSATIATPVGATDASSPFPRDALSADAADDLVDGEPGDPTPLPTPTSAIPDDLVPWDSLDDTERKLEETREEGERQVDDLDRQLDDASSSAHDAARGAIRALRDESGADPKMAVDEPASEDPTIMWAPDPDGLDPPAEESVPSDSCSSQGPSPVRDDLPRAAAYRLGFAESAAGSGADCADPFPSDEGIVHRESSLEERAATPDLDPVILWVIVGTGVAYALAHIAWSLHSRVSPGRALQHPRRLEIANTVEANPGIEISSLARNTGLSRAVARHHLAILARAGLVRLGQVGGRTAVFRTRNGAPPALAVQVVLLRRMPVRRLYALLQANPHLDQAVIAQRLGMTQQRVSLLLRRMRDALLVEADGDGRRATYAVRRTPTYVLRA